MPTVVGELSLAVNARIPFCGNHRDGRGTDRLIGTQNRLSDALAFLNDLRSLSWFMLVYGYFVIGDFGGLSA